MKRREFLTIPAQALGGTLLYTLAGEPIRVFAQSRNDPSKPDAAKSDTVRVPLRFFTEQEARIVAAACERIFPSDGTGPGATEAGVAIYIDRQLAGPYGRDKYRYTKAPWFETYPEHGYQGKENPSDTYRAGIKELGANFADLPAADQNKKLAAIEKTHFFALLRQHTIEGMFCDPMHGGNAGMIGWQLIGYPGPRMSYRDEIEAHYGQDYRVPPASLAQLAGRPGDPWENEKD